MNKRELAKRLSAQNDITNTEAVNILDCMEKEIASALKKGESVRIKGLGTFATRQRKARQGKNPKTGRVMYITEAAVPLFRPSQILKERVSGESEKRIEQ